MNFETIFVTHMYRFNEMPKKAELMPVFLYELTGHTFGFIQSNKCGKQKIH
jgi:hypothetical protein